MALNENTLKNALLSIFSEMSGDAPMTNETYAAKLAKAITDQIKTAEVPAGRVVVSVTGQAVGVTNPSGIQVG
ncbi:MAG: hypothetical protein Pg6C_16860 [Treponemataceae bacterium]|nr:MAG: hypothetical protein Pg6C_16860 [Treponemataceae bacterium]